MQTLREFRNFLSKLSPAEERMPAVFVGHGSPMNGIEENDFSRAWSDLGRALPVPTAIIVISAHWLTSGTRITSMDFPRTIHDFGGFPEELYTIKYPAPGDLVLAKSTAASIKKTPIIPDHEWGLDHGAWTVIRHMYPDAKIPVLQLSIDYSKDLLFHFELAKELSGLREKGILIMGSGNMVHNLGMVDWQKLNEPSYGYDWAYSVNDRLKSLIGEGKDQALTEYKKWGQEALLAIPTPDHYIPLLYTLGVRHSKDEATFFNDKAVGGSITMTSLLLG
jgi:4,5-DOPA dioxygenase extradiol